MQKEILLLKFNPIIQKLQDQALSLNKNCKISPQLQVEYYIKVRGQLLKAEEMELLNELVKEGEIREITVTAPTEEDENDFGLSISVPSKYELKEYGDQFKKLDEQNKLTDEEMKKWVKAAKENLENSKRLEK